MYAALFSDKDLYECQVKRLIKRASSLTDLYREKLLLSSYSDCSTDILSNLDIFASYLDFFNNSKDFQNSFSMLNELNSKNQYSICRLW
jgi:hypothetical protein